MSQPIQHRVGRSPSTSRWIGWAVLYCTVLYCTVLYCTALYCTVLQVGEVEHGAGHRLGVNVVTADRVANTVVPEEKVGRPAPS